MQVKITAFSKNQWPDIAGVLYVRESKGVALLLLIYSYSIIEFIVKKLLRNILIVIDKFLESTYLVYVVRNKNSDSKISK